MMYVCKTLPLDLSSGCMRYYFEERFYIAIQNWQATQPNLTLLDFFPVCASQGTACVNGLSFILFPQYLSNASWSKSRDCTFGLLTCFCSLFMDKRMSGPTQRGNWLACVHGSTSSYLGPIIPAWIPLPFQSSPFENFRAVLMGKCASWLYNPSWDNSLYWKLHSLCSRTLQSWIASVNSKMEYTYPDADSEMRK